MHSKKSAHKRSRDEAQNEVRTGHKRRKLVTTASARSSPQQHLRWNASPPWMTPEYGYDSSWCAALMATTTPAGTTTHEALNAELVALARYLRLQDEEVQARRDVVAQLQHVVAAHYATQSPNLQVELEVFGSFAHPAVCPFFADVDVVLRETGVAVAVAAVTSKTKAAVALANTRQASESKTEVASSQSQFKAERVRRWTEALASASRAESSLAEVTTHNTQSAITAVSATSSDIAEADTNVFADEEGEASEVAARTLSTSGAAIAVPHDHGDSTTEQRQVEADDCHQFVQVGQFDDLSDEDTADKMAGHTNAVSENMDNPRTEMLPLRATDTDSRKDDDDDTAGNEYGSEDPSVSMVAHAPAAVSIGTGRMTRRGAVDKLRKLRNKIKKVQVVRTTQVIDARVPIIKVSTRYGLEVDVGYGNQQSADTTLYAAECSAQFASFDNVIIVLKVLLRQANLDEPYRGGLGSYRLYVMLAYHLERLPKGSDTNDEALVLTSFLRRYGRGKRLPTAPKGACTELTNSLTLRANGSTTVDFTFCRVDELARLWARAWQRLLATRRTMSLTAATPASRLADLIDVTSLHADRQKWMRQARAYRQTLV